MGNTLKIVTLTAFSEHFSSVPDYCRIYRNKSKESQINIIKIDKLGIAKNINEVNRNKILKHIENELPKD